MEFKAVKLEDIELLKKYLQKDRHQSCDYSAANLILWSEVNKIQFAIVEEMLVIQFQHDQQVHFGVPLGDGDLKKAIDSIIDYCKEQNIPFRMNLIEKDMVRKLEDFYPDQFSFIPQRDHFDYVYLREELQNLTGKKYHGKKNHINKFRKNYPDWNYEKITNENTKECIDMVKKWCVENQCCEDEGKAAELCVLILGLKNREKLELSGGLIRTNEGVVAMTLGEAADDQMFIVHFEKAFASIQGAYPMINQQFVSNELERFEYVNREEDMGIEGLRKAKESYNPTFLVEKYVMERKDNSL